MSKIEEVKRILKQEVGTFDSESHTYLDNETIGSLVKEICQLFESAVPYNQIGDALTVPHEPKPDEGGLLTPKEIKSYFRGSNCVLVRYMLKAQRDLTASILLSKLKQAVKDASDGKEIDLPEELFEVFSSIQNQAIAETAAIKEAEYNKLLTEYREARTDMKKVIERKDAERIVACQANYALGLEQGELKCQARVGKMGEIKKALEDSGAINPENNIWWQKFWEKEGVK